MSQSPRIAFLDTELEALARRFGPVPGKRRGRAVAARALAGAAAPGGAEQLVALKLLVQPGSGGAVARWIAGRGGRVVSGGERVLVAELPVGSLAALEGVEGVRRAAAPKVLYPQLDRSRGEATGLEAALARHSLTGKGVVVGIVDTGIDWRHADFRDENGDTRIEALLHAARHGSTDVSRYATFSRARLNAALRRPEGPARPSAPPLDRNGHGTHCASIAAGNGRASQGLYRGVAPEAALLVAHSEPLFDDHTIWAIRRIFARAGRRPAVISLSLGHHQGAHDGTALLENVIAEESGPGRIVVVAAGNDGASGIHWQGRLTPGEKLRIPFRVADPEWQFVELWVPRGDQVELAVVAPDGESLPLGVPCATTFGLCTADWQQDPVNRDNHLRLFLEAGRPGDLWTLELRAGEVRHGEVHAWSGTVDPRTSKGIFPSDGEASASGYSLGIPATEERAIAVASWISRAAYHGQDGPVAPEGLFEGRLSPFSSHGPTRHGLQKPDIAAPGQYITAALAAGSAKAAAGKSATHSPDGLYVSLAGTSMATPLVAGIVALLLEREPKLTPEAIQQRLRATARRDADTGRVWGPGFGWGKIDALALLDYEG